MELHDVYLDTPAAVTFKDQRLKNMKIKDFAMSDNILVVLSENGSVFYSGLDKDFPLEEVNQIPNEKINWVGASRNNYILGCVSGRIFARETYENEEYPRYHGDLGLFELDQTFFNGKKIKTIGGKYDNLVAL